MAAGDYSEGKAKRKELAIFYEGTAAAACELIGAYVEDMSTDQGADVTVKKDVTGETRVDLNSYEKTTQIDPLYVTGESDYAQLLDRIEDEDLIGDEVKKNFIVVRAYKAGSTAGSYEAYRQSAVIELTGFGGDTSGVSLPHTLHWCGEKTRGQFNPATKIFTPDVAAG